MIINARKQAGLVNPDTQYHLELDIFLPSLKLAFEYQDIHHYKSADYAHQPLKMYQQRDQRKLDLAKENDITLILVPCWWDGKLDRFRIQPPSLLPPPRRLHSLTLSMIFLNVVWRRQ